MFCCRFLVSFFNVSPVEMKTNRDARTNCKNKKPKERNRKKHLLSFFSLRSSLRRCYFSGSTTLLLRLMMIRLHTRCLSSTQTHVEIIAPQRFFAFARAHCLLLFLFFAALLIYKETIVLACSPARSLAIDRSIDLSYPE